MNLENVAAEADQLKITIIKLTRYRLSPKYLREYAQILKLEMSQSEKCRQFDTIDMFSML